MYTAKDYDKALLTPEAIFASPMEVVETRSLTPEQKMAVLKRWERSAHDLEVADNESMSGGRSRLAEIGAAIVELCAREKVDETAVVQVKPARSAGEE